MLYPVRQSRKSPHLAVRDLAIVLLLAILPACSQGAGDALKSEVTAKGPVGLFFMTRYFSGSLEKAAWYFTPEGQVYQNLETGLTKEDLAAHTGPKGTFVWTGKEMEVTWADGKKSKSEVERDKDGPGFMWDMGIFTPVKPIDDSKTIVGSYEGGESLSHGGNAVSVARSLELKADGTYALEGVAAISGKTASAKLSAGSGGKQNGTWKLSGYSLVFTGADGAATRKIAFPFDDGKSFRLYVGGTLYKRK